MGFRTLKPLPDSGFGFPAEPAEPEPTQPEIDYSYFRAVLSELRVKRNRGYISEAEFQTCAEHARAAMRRAAARIDALDCRDCDESEHEDY